MTITNGIIKINLTTTSPYDVIFSWTVLQTGTVSGATSGSGNMIDQTLTGNGTVIYTVTAIEVDSGCVGETVDIVFILKEEIAFKWVIDKDYNYCEQGDAPEEIFSALTTKSVTRTTGLGSAVVTLDNSGVIEDTLDGTSIINLNTLGSNTIFTATEDGEFNLEIDFTGSASITKNAGFFSEFKFFIEINGTKVPLAPSTVNPVTGNTCQFYLLSPTSSGTRTGSTNFSGNYINTELTLTTGQVLKLYVETFTSITGASTAPLTLNIEDFKVYISKQGEDNTGYLIQPKLKKVSDDVYELALDVNNELTSETGLPQDTMDNPIDDITYKIYSPETCEVVEPTIPDCPDRVLAFQICNSNASRDDNFDIFLNGALIGAVDLSTDAQVGSVFIASNNGEEIVSTDFTCSLEGMVIYYFDPSLLEASNTIDMVNTQNNENGNFGTIGIRNYLKTGDELSDPCVVGDLEYSGDSGLDFNFIFNYTACCEEE